jgi:hypothetical protein
LAQREIGEKALMRDRDQLVAPAMRIIPPPGRR